MSAATPITTTRCDAFASNYSSQFCAQDADVTFKSLDGVYFKIHSSQLTASSEALAPPIGSTFDEEVQLQEDSETLELLFRFMYPLPQPYLGTLGATQLNRLAEAAEKYLVYSAINICYLFMLKDVALNPLMALVHGLKYGHKKLYNLAAPLAVVEPMEKVAAVLPEQYVMDWFQYCSLWQRAQIRAITVHVPQALKTSYQDVYSQNIEMFASDIRNLRSPWMCKRLGNQATETWCRNIEQDVMTIPRFEEIVTKSRTENPTRCMNPVPTHLWTFTADRSTSEYAVFRSSDEKLFQLPFINLRASSGNFALKGGQGGGPIQLEEDAATLNQLFPFLFPVEAPSLHPAEITSSLFEKVAEAAAKYQIFSAMNVCRFHMNNSLPHLHMDKVHIFAYAAQNEYPEIMNVLAPQIVSHPLDTVISRLPTGAVLPYVKYHLHWTSIVKNGLARAKDLDLANEMVAVQPSAHLPGSTLGQIRLTRRCRGCGAYPDATTSFIMVRLNEGISSLKHTKLQGTFGRTPCCSTFGKELESWKASILAETQKVPLFSTFLRN